MSDEQDAVDWLRAQVRLEREIAYQAQGLLGVRHPWFTVKDLHWTDEKPGFPLGKAEHVVWNSPGSRMADCEAKLAIIDRCEAPLPPDPEDLDERYQDDRDPDEIMRDEAMADLADDILALLADSYRHRPGWADHWACPGCGKPLHEVPDGHAMGISMQDGRWSCSDPAPPAAMSPDEFISGLSRLHPGARVLVNVAYRDDRFGAMPPVPGDGFSIAEQGWTVTGPEGPLWRGAVVSVTDDPEARQYTVELDLQGRYQEG